MSIHNPVIELIQQEPGPASGFSGDALACRQREPSKLLRRSILHARSQARAGVGRHRHFGRRRAGVGRRRAGLGLSAVEASRGEGGSGPGGRSAFQ